MARPRTAAPALVQRSHIHSWHARCLYVVAEGGSEVGGDVRHLEVKFVIFFKYFRRHALGSQVPYAYPANCGKQSESNKTIFIVHCGRYDDDRWLC